MAQVCQCSAHPRRFDHTLNKLMFTLDTESMRHKQCSPFSVCLNRTNIYQHFHLLSSKSVWLGIWLDSFHLGHTTNHVWKLIPNPMAAIARVVSPRWNGSSWMDGWLVPDWLCNQCSLGAQYDFMHRRAEWVPALALPCRGLFTRLR